MTIHLGFEVKTGHAISIPVRHTAVIGLTQESGKTTTLEALISRANVRALAFVTKRGEGSFGTGRIIQPFFQEPAEDSSQPLWQYVASLLETTLGGEKLKMQRASIMRVCDAGHEGKSPAWSRPKTLKEVAANIETAMAYTRSGFIQDMYLQLREYFRIVLPQIESLPRSEALSLEAGLNIMVLDQLPSQMQALVIASCLNWIRTEEKNTVTIIPEGWKFLSEGRSSPALAAGEQLIREGGALKNFLWLDSQDLVGIAPQIRKQIGVWILGRQGEANEAERTVKHLPAEIGSKPKPQDIQLLRKGYFYVSADERLRKVYVQPAWMDEGTAMLTAHTESPASPRPKSSQGDDDMMWRQHAEKLQSEMAELSKRFEAVEAANRTLTATNTALSTRVRNAEESLDREKQKPRGPANLDYTTPPSGPTHTHQSEAATTGDPYAATLAISFNPADIETADSWIAHIWPLVRDRIAKDPQALAVFKSVPEIEVLTKRKRVEIDGDSLRGRLALMLTKGLFDQGMTQGQAADHLNSTGAKVNAGNLSRDINSMKDAGFFTTTVLANKKGTLYQRAAGLRITTRTLETE